jgi:hypothetical protein
MSEIEANRVGFGVFWRDHSPEILVINLPTDLYLVRLETLCLTFLFFFEGISHPVTFEPNWQPHSNFSKTLCAQDTSL